MEASTFRSACATTMSVCVAQYIVSSLTKCYQQCLKKDGVNTDLCDNIDNGGNKYNAHSGP